MANSLETTLPVTLSSFDTLENISKQSHSRSQRNSGGVPKWISVFEWIGRINDLMAVSKIVYSLLLIK